MSFRDAFEKYSPHFILDAYDYAELSPQVEMLWLHIESNGTKSVTVSTIYRISGKYYFAHQLQDVLDDFEYYDDEIRDFYHDQWKCWDGLYDESRPDELPTRLILRFRPADQDFAAYFYYGDLQPGVPEEDRLPPGKLAEKWVERLALTGNDSAAPDGAPASASRPGAPSVSGKCQATRIVYSDGGFSLGKWLKRLFSGPNS